MRLIDADALYTLFVKMKSFGELTAKKAIRCVEEAPTVEAIPVEWIRKYIEEYPYMTASSMLHYWSVDQALERKAIERKKGKKND